MKKAPQPPPLKKNSHLLTKLIYFSRLEILEKMAFFAIFHKFASFHSVQPILSAFNGLSLLNVRECVHG